jgi:hypothetical protein
MLHTSSRHRERKDFFSHFPTRFHEVSHFNFNHPYLIHSTFLPLCRKKNINIKIFSVFIHFWFRHQNIFYELCVRVWVRINVWVCLCDIKIKSSNISAHFKSGKVFFGIFTLGSSSDWERVKYINNLCHSIKWVIKIFSVI